jgi:YD repeat-containing protein
MECKRVNASNIRSVGYDAAGQVLEVEFSNGSIFQQPVGLNVPQAASSKTA